MVEFLLKSEEIKQLVDIGGGCLASNKITVDGGKVGYAYREEQDANFLNDSGRRFLAGTEDNDYSGNPDNFNVFEINTICSYDDSIIPILKAKIGTAFVKSGSSFIEEEQRSSWYGTIKK